MERTIAHEFGHIVGLGHGDCSKADTVMTVIQPNQMSGATYNVGCADQNAVNQYLAIHRDDDNDQYSPDDFYASNQDCDDTTPIVHPGANIDCDNTWQYPDRDCDGQLDAWECGSPLLLDLDGQGIKLTSREEGVFFDLDSDGIRELIAWTKRDGDDAWLVLDRNANGAIDDGAELFGSFSPQPPSSEPNGFLALRVFDAPAAGGNDDGELTESDAIFSQLRLWRDTDHDGIAAASELQTLHQAGVLGIGLDYSGTWRRDQFGNILRYKARIARVRESSTPCANNR